MNHGVGSGFAWIVREWQNGRLLSTIAEVAEGAQDQGDHQPELQPKLSVC